MHKISDEGVDTWPTQVTTSDAKTSSSWIIGPVWLVPGMSFERNSPTKPGEDLAIESSIDNMRAWAFLLSTRAACKVLGGVGVSSVYSASPVT